MPELLKFRRANIVPPGGYAYEDPDTEHFITAGMFDQLVKQVKMHREANDLKVPENLSDIIEDWICQRIPVDMTSAWDNEREANNAHRRITSTAVDHATQHMLHAWRRAGRNMVKHKTAIKRAIVCTDCEYNSAHVACASCKGIIDWVKSWIPRGTPSDKVLYVCKFCAILNVAQVHMTDDVLVEVTQDNQSHKYPDHCWKKAILVEKKP